MVPRHNYWSGGPVRQAGAFQIGFSIAHLRYFAGQARSHGFERTGPLLQVPTLATGLVRREPVGVCAAIVPWNFPLLLDMWKMGPALAAGNTMVIKPDEHTPLTLLEFAKIAAECKLPPGVLNVVPGEGPVVGGRLASHPDVRKIAFTGSTAVGREIMRMAAGNVKRLTLELGGKGPNLVLQEGLLGRTRITEDGRKPEGSQQVIGDAPDGGFVGHASLSQRPAGRASSQAHETGPVVRALLTMNAWQTRAYGRGRSGRMLSR